MNVGVRVVRGPNWKWGDQDGGCVGTVIRPFHSDSWSTVQSGTVFVQWDGGTIGNYRVGKDEEFDLRILDGAPGGIKFPGITCDECKQKGLIGTRWKCSVCDDFDLCHNCYHSDKHNMDHGFIRYDCPSSRKFSKVLPRANSSKNDVLGIFPGATVARRVDEWLYSHNDGGVGGIPGTVMEGSPAQQQNSCRGSVMVLWDNGDTVEHNHGNNGKVAVQCITPAVGSGYYLDHLGVLSDDFVTRGDHEESDEESRDIYMPVEHPFGVDGHHLAIDGGQGNFFFSPFSPGDRVQVNLDVGVFQALQNECHGGWNPEMALCIGATGIVVGVNPMAVVVNYEGLKRLWSINPEALTKKLLEIGDQVKISSDEQRVKSLQRGFGGWAHKMKEDLGKIANVVGIENGGKVLVNVVGRPYTWTLNQKCCTVIQSESETEIQVVVSSAGDSESDSDSSEPPMMMLQMMRNAPELLRPEMLVQFAAKNQVPLVRAIVESYPNQINVKNCGKTALHLSCLKGHVETVEVLLAAGADVTATDDEGNTPVHYSVFRKDNPRVLEILLAKGPWCDLVNFKLISVLHLAVHKLHLRCVKALVEHGCNVNIQDQFGDTPLHDAIKLGHREIIECLVKCERFNFAITNEQGFTVLHFAAFKGESFAVEKVIEAAPQLVNQQKTDGFTALHIACINGHRDTAEILIEKGGASTELKNIQKHTPLMMALSRAKLATMEMLVLKGANPNASDMDGETCLHWILKLITSCRMGLRDVQDIQVADLYDAPEIASIVTQLPSGIREATWVGLALFLVQHGAKLSQPNSSGVTPIDLMHDQTITNLLLEANSSNSHISKLQAQKVPSAMLPLPEPVNSLPPEEFALVSTSVQHEHSIHSSKDTFSSTDDPNHNLQTKQSNVLPVCEQSSVNFPSNNADKQSEDGGVFSGMISEGECVLCSNCSADIRFLPCGHEVACEVCSLRMKRCPCCRTVISERVLKKSVSVF